MVKIWIPINEAVSFSTNQPLKTFWLFDELPSYIDKKQVLQVTVEESKLKEWQAALKKKLLFD